MDREFRVSVGALISFKEISPEEHDRKFNEILERLDRHEARFEEHGDERTLILFS